MRLAPTMNCSPWLPTTRASKLARASFTAVSSMPMASAPSAFILEWNSTRAQPSPRSKSDAPGFFFLTAPCSRRRSREMTPGRSATGLTPAGPKAVVRPSSVS